MAQNSDSFIQNCGLSIHFICGHRLTHSIEVARAHPSGDTVHFYRAGETLLNDEIYLLGDFQRGTDEPSTPFGVSYRNLEFLSEPKRDWK